jgi:HSP20 family protein
MTGFNGPWGMLDELMGLQEEMNRLFDDRPFDFRTRRGGFPPMNVWRSEDEVVVDVELPGAEQKDLDISVQGDVLTLTGRVNGEDGQAVYHRRERRHGAFTRTIQLPFTAEADQVKAQYRNGILRVRVPRAAAEKPRRIAIEAA